MSEQTPGVEEKPENLYVYAVVPASLPEESLGTGIDGARLALVSVAEGVAAVVHEHHAPPYTGPDAEVQRQVIEHGGVVERCWDRVGTILPMSFNVIVTPGDGLSASERLSDWLRRSAPALSARLAALEGRVELRVEVSLDQRLAASDDPEAVALSEDLLTRPAGVQRLLRRRLETLERGVAERRADALYPTVRRRLAALCEDLAENRRTHPPAGCVSVLSVALLVTREQVERVGLELSALQEEEPAAKISFLGPWPPYSFAESPAMEYVHRLD